MFCGEVRSAHVGNTVQLCGWLEHVRNMQSLAFCVLRDRKGAVQLVVDQTVPQQGNSFCMPYYA